jgi:NAD(P)-dependent dehydrogenase (short-subunit alcohol dehydrogenase family)
MFATELALKRIPVRVNSIAPGVYESEMTLDTIAGEEQVARVSQSIVPVPAGRPGTCVHLCCAIYFFHLTSISQSW